jgi:uncharacterized protein YbaA (DUF1428 family)
MPRYIDGYVLPVPKKNIGAYQKMATKAAKVWKKHGALAYCEAVGDDLKSQFCPGFPDLVKPKSGETIVFAFIIFKSRAHRDRVNAKAMKDPELCADSDTKKMPFDPTRMVYSGFSALVDI